MSNSTLDKLFRYADASGRFTRDRFYLPLLEGFPNDSYFTRLSISSVFSNTEFFAIRACFGDDDSLALRQVSDPDGPEDFRLIVRTHPYSADKLSKYIKQKLTAYDKLNA
jgi:hypothetical protein